MPIERKDGGGSEEGKTHETTLFFMGEGDSRRMVRRPQGALREEGNERVNRSIAEKERDLAHVAQLYLKGHTQEQIAEEMSLLNDRNYSRSTVHNDVQIILRRWYDRYVNDIQAATVKVLMQIDRIEDEYWDAWEKSKGDYEAEEETDISDAVAHAIAQGRDDMTDSHKRRAKKTIREKRDGNVKFLQGIQWCIENRMKVLGVGQTKTVNISWRTQAEEAGIDPDKLIDVITEHMVEQGLRDETYMLEAGE